MQRFPPGAMLRELPQALWGWLGDPAHPGYGVMLGPPHPPWRRLKASHGGYRGTRRKAIPALQQPELQPYINHSCVSLKTDPKGYFIIQRKKEKGLFFKAILLNVYMYRQVSE